MVSAIKDANPVIFIDDRWLYGTEGIVPEELYEVPIGKGSIRRNGTDVTVVGVSYLVEHAMGAADELAKEGIECEVIDLRSIKPFDKELIVESVKKTGRLVVADVGWKSFGAAAEISAVIFEDAFDYIKSPLARVTLPDAPAPASSPLESVYFPKQKNICDSIRKLFQQA
jgi:pyruvate dehydrogenase E1 component beta subunit